ncbi:MAG: hypothetical protein KJO05_10375 [Bacteroidia bacterium]|nr:hypothetical protein [Bacteroidia bacterium]NNF31631.1 hypothetical protein [Flavobacteriaceae bacterium]MBT8277306.1 hypothetical protein [Bacteroidia bacterium]NNJ81248.1 hypothetical protein [Flavobacteriaceae bacterium]NNK54727.1 hypothetical protein [Flavobacteriaceae bacterium]
MLLNVSYNNKEVYRKIDEAVGKPYTIAERLKRKGIGAGRLVITQASVQINNLLILDNYRNVCSVEMRPKGIIVGFRSLLESYALVIPYYKLSLYKGRAEEYSIHMDTYFIKILVKAKDKYTHRFMAKILTEKASQQPAHPSDLI